MLTRTELEVRLMTDYAPLSSVADVRTLRTLRHTCVIEAFNLHAAVHYQHHDCMYHVSTSLHNEAKSMDPELLGALSFSTRNFHVKVRLGMTAAIDIISSCQFKY